MNKIILPITVYIPEDLINNILSFIIDTCDKCKNEYHKDNLIHKCRIFNYRSIFDDYFYTNKEVFNFRCICKSCIKTFKERYIININNNTYKWVKDSLSPRSLSCNGPTFKFK